MVNLLRYIAHIATILLLALNTSLTSQEIRDYKITDRAYGITWDGTYLYYLDSERRALVRFNEVGGQEVFNLGVANMKGINFDSKEGRILVTAPRVILKLDPNTGGVVDRVHVPIPQLAGIASVDGLYYLLDLENGKVHFYDKANSMLVGGFLTDRTQPRDLTYGKNSIWVSDSSNGVIYRYSPTNGKITGSIQAPASGIRGILFSGAKLWVVDRDSKEIRNVPFVETDRFLASGDHDYQLQYRLRYTLPNVSLAKAEIAILIPPSTERQRVRNVESRDRGFRPGAFGRLRSLNKKLGVDSPRGNQTTELLFEARVSNMVYFVEDSFLKKKELVPDELQPYRKSNRDLFHLNPLETLQAMNRCLQTKNVKEAKNKLLELGFPVQSYTGVRVRENSNQTDIFQSLDTYLAGYGWLPYTGHISTNDARVFETSQTEIAIVPTIGWEDPKSPVYFRTTPETEWENLESQWEVILVPKSQSQSN